MTLRALKPAELFAVLRQAALAFGQDKAPRLAAAIAYYAVFSIAPLLLFAVAVAGQFLARDDVLNQLFGSGGIIYQNLGPAAADFLRTLVPKEDSLYKGTQLATIIGFVTLFMGATGLFVQIQGALNSMWGADPAPPMGLLNIIKTRVIAFFMIIGIGVLLLFFLALNTYLSAIAKQLGDRFGEGAFAVRALTFGLSTAFLTPVFAGVFKFFPSVKLEWREVWVGGAITSLLFTLGQLLIGIYFGRAAPGSAFAAAAALVTLLLWVYYSAMIFFFGAEVTWVYSQRFGNHAGGAGNMAKKAALNAQGAQIDLTPSEQELSALAQADSAVRDSRERVLGLPRPRLPRLVPAAPSRAEGRTLPTVRGAVWNAITAIMAVPAVIVLRLLGLTGGKRSQDHHPDNR